MKFYKKIAKWIPQALIYSAIIATVIYPLKTKTFFAVISLSWQKIVLVPAMFVAVILFGLAFDSMSRKPKRGKKRWHA